MRDWREFVRERLAGLALERVEKEEVHEELAAHLEESYELLCKRGLHEEEAAHRAVEQVSDWQDLGLKIFAAKRREHPMKKRAHQFWIPGFLTMILSMIFLNMFLELGFHPRIVLSDTNSVLLYGPWLASLPFFGALGAYVSFRAGASRTILLLASVFPVLALTLAFLLMFPIGWIYQQIIGRQNDFGGLAAAMLRDGISWILVPGAALLMGGLLVQLLFGARASSQNAVIRS